MSRTTGPGSPGAAAAALLLAALALSPGADAFPAGAAGPAAVASPPAAADAAVVTGTVTDPAGKPVAGAVVAASGGAEAVTGPDGRYRLPVAAGSVTLTAVAAGRLAATRTLAAGRGETRVDFVLAAPPRRTEEIVVQAVRADPETPITKTDISRQELERRNTGPEMPTLLEDVPSVTQYSETGSGSGYNYLSLRGIGTTRINYTLDGVPLAEPEDSNLYFVDFADLASSLDSVQVQRGVGTSSAGPASFAGSVNFASLPLTDTREISARLGLGSFGTGRASVGVQTGRIGPGIKLYVRGSWQETDGFRDHSGVAQRSLFFGAEHESEGSFFKLFGFVGRERTEEAFLAADAATLETNLRANPLSPEERDAFGQQFVQAQFTRFLGTSSVTLQGFYNGAGGWYRLWDSPEKAQLWQYGLDWTNLGGALTFKGRWDRFSLTANANVADFSSRHVRDVVDGPRSYENHGYKNEVNAFAKLGWDSGRWHLYGDAQVRWARFRYAGDIDIGSVSWTFFNPKVGVRWDLSKATALYASVGRTTREPARGDLFSGEDNPSVRYDLTAVKPEKVTAVELGVEARAGAVKAHVNLFAMEFRDEIALTGELSDIGLPLRRNAPRSFRRGLEWDVAYAPAPALRLRTTGSLNWSRISDWTQYLDVYDAAGSWVDSVPREYHDVEPLLTPPVVVNLEAGWSATPWLDLGATGRWVSRAWLDNTDTAGLETPSWFRLDAEATADLSGWIAVGHPRLKVVVDNVLDSRRLFASGYSYLYLTRDAGGESETGIPYYYPLATRSVRALLDLSF